MVPLKMEKVELWCIGTEGSSMTQVTKSSEESGLIKVCGPSAGAARFQVDVYAINRYQSCAL